MAPYRSLAFDGDVHLVHPEQQLAVLEALRPLSVTWTELRTACLTEETRRIVFQYGRMKREIAWSKVKAIEKQIHAALAALSPDEARRASATFDYTGPSLSEKSLKEHAAERLQLFPRHRPYPLTEKGLARFVSAVQHGFLPDVRRRVYTTIVDPVKQRVARRLKAKYPKATRDALASKLKTQAESEARKLTADFIRAFWPTFGRTTNQVNVALALSTTK